MGDPRSDRRLWFLFAGIVMSLPLLSGTLFFWSRPHVSLNVGQTLGERSAPVLVVAGAVSVGLLAALILTRHFGLVMDTRGRAGALLIMILGTPLYITVAAGTVEPIDWLTAIASALLLGIVIRLAPTELVLTSISVVGVGWCGFAIVWGLIKPSTGFFGSTSGALGVSTKAILGDDQLAAFFGHSNTLGLFACLVYPLVLWNPSIRPRIKALLVFVLITALLWSASRAALAAALLVSLIWAGSAVLRLRSSEIRRAHGVVVLTLLLGSLLLPLTVRDGYAFTSRGFIWMGSLKSWAESPLVGLGPTWYVDGVNSGRLGQQASSGHSLMVHVLTVAGLLGLALLAYIIWRAAQGATNLALRGDMRGASYLVALLTSGLLEYPLAPYFTSELFSVTLFPLALLSYAGLGRGGASSEAGSSIDRRTYPAIRA